MSDQNKKQRDFTFRIQRVEAGSKDETVLDFIRSQQLMSTRQLMLTTLRMCWLPFAYDRHSTDPETLKRVAQEAAYQLEQHLHYLRETFELESSLREVNSPQRSVSSVEENQETEEMEALGEYDLEMFRYD